MKMRNERAIGIFIVAAGIIILLGKLGVFGFIGRHFWPLLLLLPELRYTPCIMQELLLRGHLFPQGY